MASVFFGSGLTPPPLERMKPKILASPVAKRHFFGLRVKLTSRSLSKNSRRWSRCSVKDLLKTIRRGKRREI